MVEGRGQSIMGVVVKFFARATRAPPDLNSWIRPCIDLVCFNKNPHRKLNMSTPRRSSRLREKNEEKEAICQSLRSKRTTPGRRQEKRNVLASSSEEEEEKHEKEGLSVSEQEDEEVDVSTLISPVSAQRKPNNFLKV